MFFISHHLLGNTITSVKYNTQEETFSILCEKGLFPEERSSWDGCFGECCCLQDYSGRMGTLGVMIRRGMFSLCKDNPVLFACAHSSMRQFSAHAATQW